MLGVVGITGFADVADEVAIDLGAGLVAQGVDAGAVVHVLGKLPNLVVVHFVVVHATLVGIPAPTQRDGGVGHVMNAVVVDVHSCHISRGDGYAPPVLRSCLADCVVADAESCHHFAAVGWVVG